jgi:hypothetical protein
MRETETERGIHGGRAEGGRGRVFLVVVDTNSEDIMQLYTADREDQ